MSLIKLLTTGNSLVGLKHTENRYRMSSRRLLPKFASRKNPFRPVQPDVSTQAESKPATQAPICAVATRDTKGEPAGSRMFRQGASLLRLGITMCRNLAVATLQSRWVSQLGSMLSRPVRNPKKSAAEPVPVKPAMQEELSLDRITVVRNDLSDADLEVIAVKQPSAIQMPVLRAAAEVEPAGSVDEPAAARVFGEVSR